MALGIRKCSKVENVLAILRFSQTKCLLDLPRYAYASTQMAAPSNPYLSWKAFGLLPNTGAVVSVAHLLIKLRLIWPPKDFANYVQMHTSEIENHIARTKIGDLMKLIALSISENP